MIPHRVAPRVVKLFCAVLALFALAACAKAGPEKKITKDPAEITLPAQASSQAFQEIERQLAKFEWGPAHEAECVGCLSPSAVTIRSTGLTKDINGDNGPVKLRVVALIQNWSGQDVMHTPSNATFKANTKYLMWVASRNDKKATWGFIELGPGYDPKPKPIGLLERCKHTKKQGWHSPTDDARFSNCDDVYASRGWIKSAYATTRQAAASIASPTWVACDPDCCTGTTLTYQQAR